MDFLSKTVLIVEDDDMLRNIMVGQLGIKYNVISARDGESALQQIGERRPDLIILDLLLPKVDGFEVLSQLRAMSDPVLANTPVIVVSNLAEPQSIQLAKDNRVEAYFTKADVNLGTLTARIDRVLMDRSVGGK